MLLAEPAIEIVELCADGDVLAASIRRHRPDVAVSDLYMPGQPVLDILTEAREISGVATVIVTMAQEAAQAIRALAAGAMGYLLKDTADRHLIAAVHAAARGERYLQTDFATRISAEEDALGPGGLSPRQINVLRLIALGHTNSQIAAQLGCSLRTVESHRAQILAQLDAQERYELVEFALQHGLIGAAA